MTDETLRRIPLALLAERLRECTPEEQARVLTQCGWSFHREDFSPTLYYLRLFRSFHLPPAPDCTHARQVNGHKDTHCLDCGATL